MRFLRTLVDKVALACANVIGVRFYETEEAPTSEKLTELQAVVDCSAELTCLFYKEQRFDKVYRMGKFNKVPYTGYIVECRFHDSEKTFFYNYRMLRVLYRSHFYTKMTDEIVFRVLGLIFLRDISERLKSASDPTASA